MPINHDPEVSYTDMKQCRLSACPLKKTGPDYIIILSEAGANAFTADVEVVWGGGEKELYPEVWKYTGILPIGLSICFPIYFG